MLRAGMPAGNLWIPACDEDGNFKRKQCKGQKKCWCVKTTTGKKIPGSTKTLPDLLNMQCKEEENVTEGPKDVRGMY